MKKWIDAYAARKYFSDFSFVTKYIQKEAVYLFGISEVLRETIIEEFTNVLMGRPHNCGAIRRAIAALEDAGLPKPTGIESEPLSRLEWTQTADGILVSSKIGEAWWEIRDGKIRLYRSPSNSQTFGSFVWNPNESGIKVIEDYLYALGLCPTLPNPWAPPVIHKIDPVEEIRKRWGSGNIKKEVWTAQNIYDLLYRITELEKEKENV